MTQEHNTAIFFTQEEVNTILAYMDAIGAETVQQAIITALEKASMGGNKA